MLYGALTRTVTLQRGRGHHIAFPFVVPCCALFILPSRIPLLLLSLPHFIFILFFSKLIYSFIYFFFSPLSFLFFVCFFIFFFLPASRPGIEPKSSLRKNLAPMLLPSSMIGWYSNCCESSETEWTNWNCVRERPPPT